jgi:hypothetical protein
VDDSPAGVDTGRIARLRCALAGPASLANVEDRAIADWLLAHDPHVATQLAGALGLHGRAARWAVENDGAAGVVFAASGLPCGPAPHEDAAEAVPAARFAYADIDPECVLMRQATHPGPRVSAVRASARDPEGLLSAPEVKAIGDRLSLQLQLCAHGWTPPQARELVAAYGRLLLPGSSLVMSLWVPDGTPAGTAFMGVLEGALGCRLYAHTTASVAGWLGDAGLVVTEHGVVFDDAGRVVTERGVIDARAWPGGEWPAMRGRPRGRVVAAAARKHR